MPDQGIQGNYGSSELESICHRLTVDQLRFVTARFNHSTDKDAALEVGISPDTVTYWKRSGVPIDEAVKLLAFDGVIMAREILRRSVAEAAAIKRAGLQSDDEKIRQSASSEILDRELGKPTQRQELEISGLDVDSAIERELAKLAAARQAEDASAAPGCECPDGCCG